MAGKATFGDVARLSQRIPLPARIFLGIFAATSIVPISRWLGHLSLLIAVCLICVAGLGVLYAEGGWFWADNYPTLANLLQSFAPRKIRPSVYATTGPDGGGEKPADDTGRLARADFIPRDGILEAIDGLCHPPDILKRTSSGAAFVFLHGPEGTGKTAAAHIAAKEFAAKQIVVDREPLVISKAYTATNSYSLGPEADDLRRLIQEQPDVLKGAIIIDGLDDLAASGALESIMLALPGIGSRRKMPLLIIATGSKKDMIEYDPARKWSPRLNIEKIPFLGLKRDTLVKIARQVLEAKKYWLTTEALDALDKHIGELMKQRMLSNGHDVHRLVDDIFACQADRVRRTATSNKTLREGQFSLPFSPENEIIEADIKDSSAELRS